MNILPFQYEERIIALSRDPRRASRHTFELEDGVHVIFDLDNINSGDVVFREYERHFTIEDYRVYWTVAMGGFRTDVLFSEEKLRMRASKLYVSGVNSVYCEDVRLGDTHNSFLSLLVLTYL